MKTIEWYDYFKKKSEEVASDITETNSTLRVVMN